MAINFRKTAAKVAQQRYISENCLKGEAKSLYENYFAFTGGCCKKAWTDKKYQELVDLQEAKLQVKNKGLAKFNLRESDVNEIEPIRIFAWDDHIEGGVNAFYGASGLMSNMPAWTFIYFGDKQVYVYTLTYDMLTGSIREDAVEYFYKDVVSFHTVDSVASRDKKVMVKGCCRTKEKEVNIKTYTCKLCIVVPGDDFSVRICVSDPKYITEKVALARTKIREKKALVRVER